MFSFMSMDTDRSMQRANCENPVQFSELGSSQASIHAIKYHYLTKLSLLGAQPPLK